MGWLFGKRGKTLYFAGCTSKKFFPEVDENYKKILDRLEIDYVVLDKEICCGLPLFDGGYEKEVFKIAKKNFELFKEMGIRKIICSCPECYKMFSRDYPRLIIDWDIEVENVIVSIAENLKDGDIKIPDKTRISYHDPCYLGRYCGIYDEPRKILKIIGLDVDEMWHNKEDALCCGAGGLLRGNNQTLSNKIAKMRIKEAEDLHVNKIITACCMCVKNFREVEKEIKIEEISETLVRAMGIKSKGDEDE